MEKASVQSSTAPTGCPVCQALIAPEEPVTHCPACGVRYHAECWEYNGGCGVYGCTAAPDTENRAALEIPAAYWGREHKPCPVCSQEILAAALRCRHCGATFESARPEDEAAYYARTRQADRRPALRRASVWLFILGLLPCTAPLVTFIGGGWYWRNRRDIAALPALSAAVCKLGLVIAIAQTTLLAVVAVVHALSGS